MKARWVVVKRGSDWDIEDSHAPDPVGIAHVVNLDDAQKVADLLNQIDSVLARG